MHGSGDLLLDGVEGTAPFDLVLEGKQAMRRPRDKEPARQRGMNPRLGRRGRIVVRLRLPHHGRVGDLHGVVVGLGA